MLRARHGVTVPVGFFHYYYTAGSGPDIVGIWSCVYITDTFFKDETYAGV